MSLDCGESDREEETEQDRRVKASNEKDPVCFIELKRAVFSQLDFLQSQLGSVNFEELTSTLDPDIKQQLMAFKWYVYFILKEFP